MNAQPDSAADSEAPEYVVVLRASSAARFLPEEGCQAALREPHLAPHGVRIRTFTRWVEEAGQEIPRELIVEVRGHATSLDDAIESFARLARPVATIAGFVANVRVGALELHLAYDATATRSSREFAEVFIADERGLVSAGRVIRRHLMEAVWSKALSASADGPRISRAMRHYELALRNWHLGGEWLALNHLWIAGENLTTAVVRKAMNTRDVTAEELAHSFQLVTDDPKRPRWRDLLNAKIRQAIIFAGDDETYQTAKSASDGLEHGFLELNQIAVNAIRSADKTFYYIRRSIIDLLNFDEQAAQELISIEPRDVQSSRTIMRGRLIGSAADPAAEGQLYPTLEWQTGVASIARDGTSIRAQRKDRFTVRAHRDISFQPERIEVHGRLEHGQAVVEIAEQDLDVAYETVSPSQRVLAAVMPLIDAAASTGEEVGHHQVSKFAFNLFGQAVAFFQSISILLGARQPAEALPALRGLVILAARFEQMNDAGGAGLGIAVRLFCDAAESAAQETSAEPDAISAGINTVITQARQLGITVPNILTEPQTTQVYASLGAEMRMAQTISDAPYAAAVWHVQKVDDEHDRFAVAVDPGAFTDLVASAAAIAMLDLLKHATALLGWSVDVAPIVDLLAQAREINDIAAQDGARFLDKR